MNINLNSTIADVDYKEGSDAQAQCLRTVRIWSQLSCPLWSQLSCPHSGHVSHTLQALISFTYKIKIITVPLIKIMRI